LTVPDKLIRPTPAPTPSAGPQTVSGPPVNPTTPTLWLKPTVSRQVTLSNITESMAPKGKPGCMLFTITASLNAADGVTILGMYNRNEQIKEARIYVPPSVLYTLTNGAIKSYSESASAKGATATFTLSDERYTVKDGSKMQNSACEV
jgi:hypothetical protein